MWDVKLPNFERTSHIAGLPILTGSRNYSLPLTNATSAGSKYIFIFKIVWATASASIRLSLLSFFYRLLGHIELRRYNWVLHFNLFLVIAIWLCLVMTTVFNDTPIPAYWQFPQPPASRQLQEADSFAILSAFNTFSEIFIAALPIPLIFGKRHLPVLQRWSVVGLLCVGFLVGVVGIVRSYFCYVVFQNYDHSWWAEPYLISSEIELDTALVCPILIPSPQQLLTILDLRLRSGSTSLFQPRLWLVRHPRTKNQNTTPPGERGRVRHTQDFEQSVGFGEARFTSQRTVESSVDEPCFRSRRHSDPRLRVQSHNHRHPACSLVLSRPKTKPLRPGG